MYAPRGKRMTGKILDVERKRQEMRILVVSDSHGNDGNLRRAILAQPKAEVVIHLGDGEEELLRAKRSFPEKMFLAVRGNCDWGSACPPWGIYGSGRENLLHPRPFVRGKVRAVHHCLRRPGAEGPGAAVRPHPQRLYGL